MMTNAMRAVRNAPTGMWPGFQRLKFTPFPVTFEISESRTAVNEVTTVANAPPMMNATAISTRLPRMMKSLKPFSTALSSIRRRRSSSTLAGQHDRQERGHLRLRGGCGEVVGKGEHDQRARGRPPGVQPCIEPCIDPGVLSGARD